MYQICIIPNASLQQGYTMLFFKKQFDRLFPFNNYVSHFPQLKSCININRELPLVYQGFTGGVQAFLL